MRILILLLALACMLDAEAYAQAGNKFGTPGPGVAIAGAIALPQNTVAKLPGCNNFSAGMLMGVLDASSSSYGATLVGGGSTKTLAYCDGTNWTQR